jgi:hypothetical protein
MARARASVLVLAIVVGCGFPNLSYEAGDGGPPQDGASTPDGDSSSSSGGADAAQDWLVDGPTSDGASSSSSGGEAGNPCDQDADGYDNASCGGKDCCDTDAKAHPGQAAWFTAQDNCMSFDYDCDGKEEHEYPASLTCGYVWSLGCIPSCSGTSCVCGGVSCSTGYVGPDPGCGVGAEYDQCQPANAFSCAPKAIAPMQVQACH